MSTLKHAGEIQGEVLISQTQIYEQIQILNPPVLTKELAYQRW